MVGQAEPFIKPESITLGKPGSPFQGEILAKSFLGALAEYEVEFGSGCFQVFGKE